MKGNRGLAFGLGISSSTKNFIDIKGRRTHALVAALLDLVKDLDSNLVRRTKFVVNFNDLDPIWREAILDTSRGVFS